MKGDKTRTNYIMVVQLQQLVILKICMKHADIIYLAHTHALFHTCVLKLVSYHYDLVIWLYLYPRTIQDKVMNWLLCE